MAVRRERVELDLTDRLTPGLARAAVAAGILDRALKDLDGSSVKSGRSLDKPADGAKKVGDSSRKAGPDIDKFSGRLRAMADAAVILGPALIPIGAAGIPVLTAALAGLGAAAGGIGTAVLAFHGIADGLKAINEYQLEPTAENLSKLRIEMEKLGPAGAEFARYLDDLEPQMANLQKIARAGLFPGVEDGIDALLTRLPQVRRIVFDLADGMGNLAREAGEGLAGDKFTAFFDYLETDARPTLEAFSQSAGNVAEGVANLLVAFAPLNRDFTQGLEGATEAFARWSRGLDENQSFQDFLQYVRESGPQVAQLIGAMASAIAGLIQAAAPLGQVVVLALTAMAKAFAAIAESPIGPPLYTAAAGLLAFNRAAALSGNLSDKMAASFANLGIQAETTKGKLANIGLAGAAAALALGTVSDAQEILDSRSRSNDTLNATVKSLQDLQDTVQASNLGKYADDLHIDLARLTDDLAKNGSQGEYAQKVLTDLTGASHGFGAAAGALAGNILPFYTANADKAYDANKDLKSIIAELGFGLGKTPGLFGGVVDSIKRATDAAHDLSGALANLNGWFDKRQAIRDYRDAIHDLTKGLKNGFTRKDVEHLDAAGRSILQIAESIKDPALKEDFLAGARKSLVNLAETSSPKAAAAIQRVIDKFDSEGFTHPPTPTVKVDDKATPKLDQLDIHLRRTGNTKATPKVDVDPGNSLTLLDRIRAQLGGLHDKTINVTVNQRGGVTSSAGGHTAPHIPTADGGSVPKSGRPYADRYPYLLADGEEVISNRSGQADRHRGLLKAINAGRLADGGTAGLDTPLFTSEGPRYYKAAYRHNRPFAVDPSDPRWPYQTGLTDALNRAFEKWVNDWDIPFDMGARIVDYDMRGFFKKARPKRWTEGQHFPDTFKTPYDTTFSHESKYATKDNPFYWQGDKLVDTRNGQVVFAADGGTVPRSGRPYDDRHPYMLADGEEVISNRHGQADRHRSLLKAINSGRKADGGTAGRYIKNYDGSYATDELTHSAHAASQGLTIFVQGLFSLDKVLKILKAQLEDQQKAFDKAKAARDSAISRRDSISSTIQQGLQGDSIWAGSTGSVWASGAFGANTPQGAIAALDARKDRAQRLIAAIATLKQKGITGPALLEILNEGLEAAEAMAAADVGTLSTFSTAVGESNSALAAAGLAGGNAVEGDNIREWRKQTAAELKELREIKQAIRDAEKANDKAQDRNAKDVKDGVNGAASRGHRRGR